MASTQNHTIRYESIRPEITCGIKRPPFQHFLPLINGMYVT